MVNALRKTKVLISVCYSAVTKYIACVRCCSSKKEIGKPS